MVSTHRVSLIEEKKRKKKEQHIPIFSTLYSLEICKARNIVERYIPLLFKDEIYTKTLNKSIIVVSRRAPSLSQYLSTSNFSSNLTEGTHWLTFKGNLKCGSDNCPC